MSRLETVRAAVPATREWTANWIWTDADPQPDNAYRYFRREIDIEDPINSTLYITADTRYKLYVNGNRVGEGPPQSQPYHTYYDTYHLDNELQSGINCIAVIVNHTGTIEDTRAGLLAELQLEEEVVLKTNETWRTTAADAWSRETQELPFNDLTTHQEHHDARQVPVGWTEAGFSDDDWQRAEPIENGAWKATGDRPPTTLPWTYLIERPIPRMETVHQRPEAIEAVHECLHLANRKRSQDRAITLSQSGSPIDQTAVSDVEKLCDGHPAIVQNSTDHLTDHTADGIYDPCIVLDFGRVITARLQLELNGPSGGTVDIGYAERLIDGAFNNAIEQPLADRYVVRGDDDGECFRTFTWKGFRYVKLRFSECFEPTEVSVTAEITRYPFEDRGAFESDDPVLNEVFDISQYTLRLCSNDAIMDTPWREQSQWVGDVSAVTLGGIYSCFGDTDLPAKFLRQSGANQQLTGLLANQTDVVDHEWESALADYSLWWINALWEHYLYTNEAHWIHTFYPHVGRILQVFLRYIDTEGLLANMPYWSIIDWADLDRRGEFGPLNALFYDTLARIRKMARFKGDEYTAELATELRAGIADSFVDRLYDSDRGCLVDANVDGKRVDTVSEHCNAAAIHFGLTDDELTEELVESLWEADTVDVIEAQPFFTSIVLQALADADRMELALDMIRERWGERMVERGYRSTLEEWGQNGSWRDGSFDGFLRSHSHAWSAYPAEFLIRDLAGFEIREPGCSTVALDPYRAEFDYQVTIPTQKGPIQVSNANQTLTIDSPAEVTVDRST